MVVSGEPRALARAADAGAVTVVDDRGGRAVRGRARWASRGPRSWDASARCWCPATARSSTADELRDLAARAESLDVAIVPDRHGAGTNALALAVDGEFEPQFGPGSRARHVEQATAKGLAHEVMRVPSLELDVDTREDASALEAALARFPARAPAHALRRSPARRGMTLRIVGARRCRGCPRSSPATTWRR